jgi:tryptophanyl-tRNA synthetase
MGRMTAPARRTSLTGIKPTGVPHLGNYVGAIRPAIELAREYDAFYFIADYHALTTVRDPAELAGYTRSVAATWLACGLDPEVVTLYRQSDVPETFELQWVLSCMTSKGLMNRAHAYKAVRDRNREAGADEDDGVSMGLYNYPVLMAADIIVMAADVVPVGRDQIQHVEYARDIAERFNQAYGARFALPVPEHVTSLEQHLNTVPGLDGRKMSKSYDNAIPLFEDPASMRKLIRRVTTDSTPVEAPKDPDASALFAIHRQFSDAAASRELRERMLAGGMGWGQLKDLVADRLEEALAEPRRRYGELMADRAELDAILASGSERARERAAGLLASVRAAVGIG